MPDVFVVYTALPNESRCPTHTFVRGLVLGSVLLHGFANETTANLVGLNLYLVKLTAAPHLELARLQSA